VLAVDHKEFSSLRELAHQRVYAGDWPLRLGVSPSFHGESCIGLRSEDRLLKLGTRLYLTWRRWDYHTDLERLEKALERGNRITGMSPTIEEKHKRVDDAFLSTAIADLAAVQIPAAVNCDLLGTDGSFYHVRTDQFWVASGFKWWSKGPPEWRPLALWFARTWQSFARELELDPELLDPYMLRDCAGSENPK
jgi:hypothetical protein